MTGLGPGCSFAPRCSLAEEKCLHVEPRLAPADLDRLAACWVVERGSLAATVEGDK